MEMTVDNQGEKVLMSITGSIDERGAEELKRRFLDMDVSKIKEVVLDFAAVSFIGSAGIGKLLLFYKNVAGHGGQVIINNMSKDIYTMFKVVKLDKVFNMNPVD